MLGHSGHLMEEDQEKLAWQLLEALFELGRADIAATPEALADWLDVPQTRVQSLLPRLDAQGLVDSQRCRLSMKGLVLALSMHGAHKLYRQSAAA